MIEIAKSVRRRPVGAGLGLVLGVCLSAGVAAQEGELLQSEAGGQLSVAGASRLRVSGIQGGLVMRGGKSGELRYEARRLDDRRTPLPLALWRNGSTLSLEPLEELRDDKMLLEVAVPVELGVEIDLRDCRIEIGGLHAAIEVRGEGLDGDLRGINGLVTVEVSRSRLRIDGVAGSLYLEGDELELIVKRVGRDAELRVGHSLVELSEVAGSSDFELESTTLAASALQGQVQLRAAGGEVRINGAARGVRAELEEAKLTLGDVTGRVEIESDSDVEFRDLKAQLTINNFGGAVRGSGNSGPTFVRTQRSPVTLENMEGSVSITGDGLTVRIGESSGSIILTTTASEIALQKPGGTVRIENDFGNVQIDESGATVEVVNRQGDVEVTRARDVVNLQADGGNVSVSWAEFPREDQLIQTDGEMTARFPLRSACRIEAESSYGRIDSELARLRVADDERFASGVLNGASQPVVQLKAGGNMYIAYALDE